MHFVQGPTGVADNVTTEGNFLCTEEKLLLTECGAVFASAKVDCANMLQMLGKGDVIDEAVIDDLDKIADTGALREM